MGKAAKFQCVSPPSESMGYMCKKLAHLFLALACGSLGYLARNEVCEFGLHLRAEAVAGDAAAVGSVLAEVVKAGNGSDVTHLLEVLGR